MLFCLCALFFLHKKILSFFLPKQFNWIEFLLTVIAAAIKIDDVWSCTWFFLLHSDFFLSAIREKSRFLYCVHVSCLSSYIMSHFIRVLWIFHFPFALHGVGVKLIIYVGWQVELRNCTKRNKSLQINLKFSLILCHQSNSFYFAFPSRLPIQQQQKYKRQREKLLSCVVRNRRRRFIPIAFCFAIFHSNKIKRRNFSLVAWNPLCYYTSTILFTYTRSHFIC